MKTILEVTTTRIIKNDELHDILIEAQSEIDEEKRNELYKQAQEIIHEEAPWVPLAHSTPLLGGEKQLNWFPTTSNWIGFALERRIYRIIGRRGRVCQISPFFYSYNYIIRKVGEVKMMLSYIGKRLLAAHPCPARDDVYCIYDYPCNSG